MNYKECTCANCGKTVMKDLREYNRSMKLGRRLFCSRSCSSSLTGRGNVRKNRFDISQSSNNGKDSYSFVRYYLKMIRYREPNTTLTLEDLKTLWESQSGKCIYTGIDLIPRTHVPKKDIDPWLFGSIDRIDSSIGYINGNIQFVSTNINYLKSSMSHEQTIQFLKILKDNEIVQN